MRCNIYILRLCYDFSVRLSVRLSVTEVHWRIIANLGFKFQFHFTTHCGRRAARRAACGGSSRAMLASASFSFYFIVIIYILKLWLYFFTGKNAC